MRDNTGNCSTAEQTAIQRKGETENGRGTDTGFTAKAINSLIHQERKGEAQTQVLLHRPPTIQLERKGVRDRERERHRHRFYCKGRQPYRIEGEKRSERQRKGETLTQATNHTKGEVGRGTDTGFNSFIHKEQKGGETEREEPLYLSSGRVRLLVMRGNPDGAPSWSRSFSSQGRLSPTSLSTDLQAHTHTQRHLYTLKYSK